MFPAPSGELLFKISNLPDDEVVNQMIIDRYEQLWSCDSRTFLTKAAYWEDWAQDSTSPSKARSAPILTGKVQRPPDACSSSSPPITSVCGLGQNHWTDFDLVGGWIWGWSRYRYISGVILNKNLDLGSRRSQITFLVISLFRTTKMELNEVCPIETEPLLFRKVT